MCSCLASKVLLVNALRKIVTGILNTCIAKIRTHFYDVLLALWTNPNFRYEH